MKRVFSFAFLFFTVFFYGQKTYFFDYLIEYESKRSESEKAKTVYLLTNSKDNSYHVIAHEYNDAVINLYFRDVKGLYSSSAVHKNGFFMAENIDVPCESVRSRKVKSYVKMFDFMVNADTLIQNQKYRNYSMQYRKERDSKKYKQGKSYYIIEQNTEFHKPLLLFSTVFDVLVTSEIFPNGIAKEMYNSSKFGIKSYYKLLKYTKVNKTITIPNCPKLQP